MSAACVVFGALEELDDLEMRIHGAADAGAARRLLDSLPAVSLLIIDGRVGRARGTELLNAAKRAHPDLPVLWVASRELETPLHGEHIPDRQMVAPVDRVQLGRNIDSLIPRRTYHHALCNALRMRISGVLGEAFGVDVSSSELGIRANASPLGEIETVLPFCGRTLAGHIVVSSSERMLRLIRRRLLGRSNPTRAELQDLAGEIANLLLGRIKAYFEQRQAYFELGVPSRFHRRGPSLAVTFGTELHIVFGFDTFDADTHRDLALDLPPEMVASGEVCFL